MTDNQRTVRGAVATRDQQQAAASNSIATFIRQMQPEIERALPKHMDADRMARLLLTAIRQTPKLATCDPQAFAGAVLTASALGLEPNLSGEAYLIPYGRECQLVIGYQGLVKLFWQHPLAAHIDAQAVYARDEFDYAYGLDPFLRHKPATGDRGDVIAYYGVAALKTGAKMFVVLSPEEVKALRQGNVGPSGKITDPMRWMERKTVLRQLFKTLPRSTDLNHALASDETAGSTLRARQIAGGTEPVPAPQLDGPPPGMDPTTGEVPITDGEPVTGEILDEEPPGWSA
ncbi:MAG: recombinase RecT [Nocardioides sp.]